jgi:hypothetical protein
MDVSGREEKDVRRGRRGKAKKKEEVAKRKGRKKRE